MDISHLASLMLEGHQLYQQGEFSKAQKAFINAKLTALGLLEKGGDQKDKLEDILHGSNRVLAITHIAKGNEKYNLGVVAYDPQTGIIDPKKRSLLETAVESYHDAENAFLEFDASFRTPDERLAKIQWLGQLYNCWIDAEYKLAVDFHNQGAKAISEATSNGVKPEELREGLKIWDKAMRSYGHIVEIALTMAGRDNVQVHPSYVNSAVQSALELTDASIQWANVLGDKALEQSYREKVSISWTIDPSNPALRN